MVGSRGLGGVAGLLLGSVSAHVAAHALCPVLVIPQAEPASRPCPATVVVGVDGSTGSLAALRFALGHAHIHRLPVHAIHARAETSPRPEQEIQQWVAETMAALPRNHSSLVVTTSTLSEPTLAALLPHSRHASLLAVGSRGLGRVRAQILGSVSQELLRRASCPVAIVKHHR